MSPSELEAVLMTHPQVLDAGVVGLSDPSAGELPLAFVVKKPGATVTELELQQYVGGMIAVSKFVISIRHSKRLHKVSMLIGVNGNAIRCCSL